ncbi:hypothetical protein LPUS_09507 [Lasallia pustulata]|uniref:Uncharacterized protein n=1 Tax=Lasallia pustulata TaxID=136370 RepID=A0A1W5D853_9LECA|nr:hypothetical protein LPUS_09507 [Lasallia pustulata]
MSLESLQRRSCSRVPDPFCLVTRTGRQLLTVGREGDGVDPIQMAFESLQRRSRSRIPDPRRQKPNLNGPRESAASLP